MNDDDIATIHLPDGSSSSPTLVDHVVMCDLMVEQGYTLEIITDARAELDRIRGAHAGGLRFRMESGGAKSWWRAAHRALNDGRLGNVSIGFERSARIDLELVVPMTPSSIALQPFEAAQAPVNQPAADRPPATWRPMRDGEAKLIIALRGARMSPGSWDKRFARDLGYQVDQPVAERTMTDPQSFQLRRMVHKYRAQIRAMDIAAEDRHLLEDPPKRPRKATR